MAHTLSFHSFRRGVGKSTLAANTAVLLAQAGARVGLLDLNFSAPSQQMMWGLAEPPYTANDFLWGKCEIEAAVCEAPVPGGPAVQLIPASAHPAEINRMLRGGYYLPLLAQACEALLDARQLDYLVVDTPAGLTEETLMTFGATDVAVILLRLDQQDYEGTALLADLARRLEVPQVFLAGNEIPPARLTPATMTELRAKYHFDVAGMLPHTPELQTLGSSGVFALRYPAAPLTAALRQLVRQLTPPAGSAP